MLLVLPFFFFFLFVSGELHMACSSSIVKDIVEDLPRFGHFFPWVRFCFSPSQPRFFFKRSIKVSFSDELLSLTSRLGNLDNGSLGFSGHIPHAVNLDCIFFSYFLLECLLNVLSKEGKYFLSNDPSVHTSFFHSSSITLHDLFKEENTTTSRGFKRCVTLGGNITK